MYISTQENPFHISESENKKLAEADVTFDMDIPYEERKIYVGFIFGMPEVICNIYDQNDKFLERIAMDFKLFFE